MGQAVRTMSDVSAQESSDNESIDSSFAGDCASEPGSDSNRSSDIESIDSSVAGKCTSSLESNSIAPSDSRQSPDNDRPMTLPERFHSMSATVGIWNVDDSSVSAAQTITGRGLSTGKGPQLPWTGYALNLISPQTESIAAPKPPRSPKIMPTPNDSSIATKSELLPESEQTVFTSSLQGPNSLCEPMTPLPGEIENLVSLMQNHTLADKQHAVTHVPHIPSSSNSNFCFRKEIPNGTSYTAKQPVSTPSTAPLPTSLFGLLASEFKFSFSAHVRRNPNVHGASKLDGGKVRGPSSLETQSTTHIHTQYRKILPMPTPRRQQLRQHQKQHSNDPKQPTPKIASHTQGQGNSSVSLPSRVATPTMKATSRVTRSKVNALSAQSTPPLMMARPPSLAMSGALPSSLLANFHCSRDSSRPVETRRTERPKPSHLGNSIQVRTEPNPDPVQRDGAKKMKRSEAIPGETDRKVLLRRRDKKWKTEAKEIQTPSDACRFPKGTFDFSVQFPGLALGQPHEPPNRCPVSSAAQGNGSITRSHAKSSVKSPPPNPPAKGTQSATAGKKKKDKALGYLEEPISDIIATPLDAPANTSRKGKKAPRRRKENGRGVQDDLYDFDVSLFQSTNPDEWICAFCQYEIFCHGVESARRKGGFYRRRRERRQRLQEVEARRSSEPGSPMRAESEGGRSLRISVPVSHMKS